MQKEHGDRNLGTLSREDSAPKASFVDRNSVLRIATALYEQRPTPSGLGRRLASGVLAPFLYESTGAEVEEYHKWYYNTNVWKQTTWMGVDCWKSVSDMWNYQEILFDLKPSLFIEFGTAHGGSAMFFADTMRRIGEPFNLLSVDVTHQLLNPIAQRDPDVQFVKSRSTVPAVAEHIRRLQNEIPGKTFAILDSDHSMEHVLAEMKLLRPLLKKGDYLIVEDSMLNGHPNLPGWGPGPYEAIEAYEEEFPNDYTHDVARENKFGFTFAPYGFLIRN
ncbi:methyltransferase [Mycolicibacterium gilvum]|uniref:Rhamnosyl O-methyltransferase n=1 Tax=Mycolicibacterium gilvum TaxID=1804 RepID=A0A378SP25_9MYCO|nr:methyltransferase [Mycolicibacterium gilvum]